MVKLLKNQSQVLKLLTKRARELTLKALKKSIVTQTGPHILRTISPEGNYSYSEKNMGIIIPVAYLLGVRVSYRRVLGERGVRIGLCIFGKSTNVDYFVNLVSELLDIIYSEGTKEACFREYSEIDLPPFKKRKYYGVPKKYASDISLLLYDYIELYSNKTLEVWGNNPNILGAREVSILRPNINVKTVKGIVEFKVKSRNVRLCDFILNPIS